MAPLGLLTSVLTLIGTLWPFGQAQSDISCNPLAAVCPANPGLATSSYFVDFTRERTLPANWTLANDEHVTYGANGAEFTFAQRFDAPCIWTNFFILFGRVEVVMQAASGVGIISSTVLISDDQDEIDWEFSGNDFNTGAGKVQTNYFGKGVIGNYDRGTYPAVHSPQSQFHTYVLDWTSTTLTWSIDGVVVRTLSNTHTNSGPYQYPQSPMKLQIGLWDGGDMSNAGGTVEWAGGYTDLSQAPFTMRVKSVRITIANPCSGGYQYTDMSGVYQSIQCLDMGMLSSSNSTLLYRPNGSNPGGSARVSSFLLQSSSASLTTNLIPVTLMSVGPFSDTGFSIQTSSTRTGWSVQPSMPSTVTSNSTRAITGITSGQVTAMPPFTGAVTSTIRANASIISASEAPASPSTQPASSPAITNANICTASTLASPSPVNSAGITNSTVSATILVPGSATTPLAIVPTGPVRSSLVSESMISTAIPPAISTAGAGRLLPRVKWIAIF